MGGSAWRLNSPIFAFTSSDKWPTHKNGTEIRHFQAKIKIVSLISRTTAGHNICHTSYLRVSRQKLASYAVQSEFSDFGFEMQDLSDFEMSFSIDESSMLVPSRGGVAAASIKKLRSHRS